MSVLLCDKMHSIGPLKHLKINYPTITENDITPLYLPNTEPATPQLSITLNASHLGTVEGVYAYGNALIGVYAGKNTNAGAVTLYVTVKVNSTTVYTGSSSITAGYYWTFNLADQDTYNVQVGDVVDIYFHASTADVMYLDYHATYGVPTRIKVFPTSSVKNRMRRVTTHCAVDQRLPVLTGGVSPFPSATNDPKIYNVIKDSALSAVVFYNRNDVITDTTYETNIYGTFRAGWGDSVINATIFESSSIHPMYRCTNARITDIYYLIDIDNN